MTQDTFLRAFSHIDSYDPKRASLSTWQLMEIVDTIDKVLGLRCTSFGYQYGEIAGSLSSVYFCGGDCVEDVTSHLMPHLLASKTISCGF